MKYIIDISDDRIGDFVGSTHLLMPYTRAGHKGHHDTGLNLTPYTEPDRKAIDLQHAHDIENVAKMNYNEGAKDAWEFARAVNDMGYDDFVSCFGGKTEEMVYELSYSEVKAQYEAWKRTEEEIHVGDEVTLFGRAKGLVYIVGEEMLEGVYSNCDRLIPFCWRKKDCRKTGKHFPEIAELLKKMKEGDRP